VEEIRSTGRNAQGVKIMSVDDGERVVAVESVGEIDAEGAEGGGEVGALDAPSFVAAILEWVVAGYFRSFEAVESELEELDARAMSDTPKAATAAAVRLDGRGEGDA
jgi:hypothetical protein